MKRMISWFAFGVLLSAVCLSSTFAQEQRYSKILVATKVFEALGKLGDRRATEAVRQGLKSKEFFIRAYSAQAAGTLRDIESVPALKELLNDENYLVRIYAARALFELGEKGAEDKLVAFLDDENPAARANAIEQLAKFKEKYMPKIAALLAEETSSSVRMKAVQELGDHRFAPATPLLLDALKDESAQVRQAACIALGMIGDKNTLSAVISCFNDSDPLVRAAARQGVSLFKGVGKTFTVKIETKRGKKSSQQLHKLLWEGTANPDPLLRSSSYIALANLKDVSAIPMLLKVVTDPSVPVSAKKGAARALRILKPYVMGMAKESLSKTRGLPADILGAEYAVNGKSLILTVTEALNDPKNPLHEDASFILEEMRERCSLPALRHALYAEDPETVASCAYVLGELDDKEAVPDLIQAARRYGF